MYGHPGHPPPHTHTHIHTQLAAQSDVPDTRTLPPPYPKLKSECSNPSLEHHLCPMDIPASLLCVSPLAGLSICPSIRWGSAMATFSRQEFFQQLLQGCLLTRSGCSLPSASPAASSGGLVSACPTMGHHAKPYHTCNIYPYQGPLYSAISCQTRLLCVQPTTSHQAKPHSTTPHPTNLATPCYITPSLILPCQTMPFSIPGFWDS